MTDRPRVLVVGAGAVGQVFGWYLQRAGAELCFLVKEKHAPEARRGFTLYALGLLEDDPEPLRFSGFDVRVSVDEVARERWDQVWLGVSSPALREGDWVEALARATGEATWVMLQPGLDDRDWLRRWIPAERLVAGMVPFLSYHAPLAPGARPARPGTAFWIPPLTRGPFSGPPERLQAVLRTLRAGGYPARETGDAVREAALPSAVLAVFVTELEAVGWSFERFLQRDVRERFSREVREAVTIAARHTGASADPVLSLLRPGLVRLLLPLAERLPPVDLETYLQAHFTKVGAQTREMMRRYVELGQAAGLPVQHLQALPR